jgi:hypothetical protein
MAKLCHLLPMQVEIGRPSLSMSFFLQLQHGKDYLGSWGNKGFSGLHDYRT